MNPAIQEGLPMEIGTILKQTRKRQGLSQKELSDGICAQSMLSAVENNQYTPMRNC